jgi:four helix bundle protein
MKGERSRKGVERDGKPWDIAEQTLEYGVRAVRLYRALCEKKDGAGWVIGKQYLRAATSIGANIAEAQSAESKADFVHKYGIAQKEARESEYWLNLLEKAQILPPGRLKPLQEETGEIIAIITTIIVNSKRKKHA